MAEYRRQIIQGAVAAVILAISIGLAVIYVPTLTLQPTSTASLNSTTSTSTSSPVTIHVPPPSSSETSSRTTTAKTATVTLTISPSGTIVTHYVNGTTSTVYRNGTETTIYENQTETTTLVSYSTFIQPITVTEFSSGSSVSTFSSPCPSFHGPGIAPLYCLPIVLTNDQSSPTAFNTQLLINVDWSTYAGYLASNVGNVLFADASGMPLHAWCEANCGNSQSSSTVWVRDDAAIEPSGQQMVYLYIFPTSALEYNSTGYWGAYPTFTSTYGEYDNGPSVFTFYNNFNGTSLCSCMSVFGSPALVVNNGVVILTSSCLGCGIQTNAVYLPNVTFDSLTQAPVGSYYMNIGPEETSTINQNGVIASYGAAGSAILITQTGGVQHHTLSQTEPAGYAVWSDSWASTEAYQQVNYGSQLSTSTDVPSIALPWTLLVYAANAASISAQWTRIRVFPPNNILPSVSFGTIAPY